MSILRNLGLAIRMAFRRQPFPLRCGHCDAPIRRDGHLHGVAPTTVRTSAFADPAGFYRCCTTGHATPHRPMPGALRRPDAAPHIIRTTERHQP